MAGGYTLYYATNFIFTGLAVAGGLPRAALQHRGRGAGSTRRPRRRHRASQLRLAGTGPSRFWRRFSAPRFFGAAWAAVPAYLQAKRGQPHRDHHDHVSTSVASALLVYLLVNVFRVAGLHGGPKVRASPRPCTCPAPPNSAGFSGLWRLHPPLNFAFFRRAGSAAVLRLDSDLAARGWATRSGPLAIPKRRRVYAGINPTPDHHDNHADLGRACRG